MLHPHAGYQVHETAEGVAVDLPSPRRPLTAVALVAWLAGWAVGVMFVIQQFTGGERLDSDRVFLLAWAAIWVFAGFAAIGYVTWLVAGRERITLGATTLKVWYGVGRWGFGHSYAVADITELRPFGRELAPVLAAGLDLAGRGASGVRFRCEGRVVLCARALDERAARALIELLRLHADFGERAGRSESPAA